MAVRIDATRGVVTLVGGTLLSDRREASVQEPPDGNLLTLELLLQRDSWIPTLGLPAGFEMTRLLLDGLRREPSADGTPGETHGWDNAVRPGLITACTELDCSVVQRITSSVVIITLPAFPEYDITQPETLVFTAPRGTTPTLPHKALCLAIRS